MPDNPHMGHRQRMLDKFRRFGLEIFSDHEVLEMLLYFAVRQGDTNPTAHCALPCFTVIRRMWRKWSSLPIN